MAVNPIEEPITSFLVSALHRGCQVFDNRTTQNVFENPQFVASRRLMFSVLLYLQRIHNSNLHILHAINMLVYYKINDDGIEYEVATLPSVYDESIGDFGSRALQAHGFVNGFNWQEMVVYAPGNAKASLPHSRVETEAPYGTSQQEFFRIALLQEPYEQEAFTPGALRRHRFLFQDKVTDTALRAGRLRARPANATADTSDLASRNNEICKRANNLLTETILRTQLLQRDLPVSLRETRLNCWVTESAQLTNVAFRKNVIEFYKRSSNAGKFVKCQILDTEIDANALDAYERIVVCNIWKASTHGEGLCEVGLQPEDVNNPRNGMFLTRGINDAFKRQQVCFLYNMLVNKLILWVADTNLLSKTIAGSETNFADVHEKPLLCPPNCMPFRRLLSWHARLTLQLRPETVVTHEYAYDATPGVLSSQSVAIDPLAQAIQGMVQPGDDASHHETMAWPNATNPATAATCGS